MVRGLTSDEVAQRIRDGLVNRVRRSTAAEYRDIVVRNVVTLFNALVVPAAVALLLWTISKAASPSAAWQSPTRSSASCRRSAPSGTSINWPSSPRRAPVSFRDGGNRRSPPMMLSWAICSLLCGRRTSGRRRSRHGGASFSKSMRRC